jgi:hypothetical protein
MLCDRCVLNGKCEFFVPAGECRVERDAYDWLYSELVGQYGLRGLADEVLVGRVVMYLIRIVRAEVYEANVGVSDASTVWGKYIGELHRGLTVLLRDLALTKAERRKLEKDDVLVDVDRLLDGAAKRSRVEGRVKRRRSPMNLLLEDWTAESPGLRCMVTGGRRGRGGGGGGRAERKDASEERC